eukprot:CAMPEP_0198281976 /NCGR_PEP_ID=MMETSP1449-20131203/1853_1 /TAXON_ID=420275 /ORGANISM="Attheya septentrionalis, Strain CCMP2084" /LENGTH=599 /DNA_ID=CAMNT_0043978019 /DNA_START=233 /DNA_END=2032 /DNA_ORIENTATION=-
MFQITRYTEGRQPIARCFGLGSIIALLLSTNVFLLGDAFSILPSPVRRTAKFSPSPFLRGRSFQSQLHASRVYSFCNQTEGQMNLQELEELWIEGETLSYNTPNQAKDDTSTDIELTDEFIIEHTGVEQLKELEHFLEHQSHIESEGHVIPSDEASFDPFQLSSSQELIGSITSNGKSPPVSTSSSAATEEESENVFLSAIWKARLLLIAAAALYGTNFTVVKIVDESIPVGIATALRFGMAAIVGLPWLLAPSKPSEQLEEKGVEISPSEENFLSSSAFACALAGFEVGAWNSLGYVAQAIGLQTTDASKSAFICSLAVVVVPMLDFLTGKKMKSREVIGASMAIFGVGLLEMGGMSAESGLGGISFGDMCSLVQPVAFGLGFWRMEKAMQRFPDDAARMTAAQLLAVFVSSATYCAISFSKGMEVIPDMTQLTEWLTDPMILGALFWTGLITTALTVYMETLALKTLSAAETTLIFSTEPLWGSAFAAAVVGERFGMDAAIGAGLILGGCAYSNIGIDFLKQKNASTSDEVEENSNIEGTQNTAVDLVPTSLVGIGAAEGLVTALVEAEDMFGEASATLDGADGIDNVIQSTLDNIS